MSGSYLRRCAFGGRQLTQELLSRRFQHVETPATQYHIRQFPAPNCPPIDVERLSHFFLIGEPGQHLAPDRLAAS
jgi:hypothetical protein